MAVDVAVALDHTVKVDYDVVVLDRDLPGLPGDEVCRRLMRKPLRTRVLMLTAAGTVADRAEGLSLGADDYLPKPFGYPELVARIRALGQRSRPAVPTVLGRGDLTLNQARRVATRVEAGYQRMWAIAVPAPWSGGTACTRQAGGGVWFIGSRRRRCSPGPHFRWHPRGSPRRWRPRRTCPRCR
jgi:CheY-like chemotaxis protein